MYYSTYNKTVNVVLMSFQIKSSEIKNKNKQQQNIYQKNF